MISDHGRDLLHGAVGTITPALGVITSMQEQIEWGMRITSLVIGIIVGLLSLRKLLKKR
jgi:hypothetical protein